MPHRSLALPAALALAAGALALPAPRTAAAAAPRPAAVDVVELRDGTVLEGTYAGGTSSTLRFEVDGRVRVLQVTELVNLTFDATAPAPPAVASAPAAARTAEPEPTPATPAASTPPKRHNLDFYNTAPDVLIPAGTRLLVRTVDAVDSNRHGAGHRFGARLEGDLVVEGEVVARRGADVYGVVTDSRRSGRVVGRAELGLTLTGVAVGGQIVRLRTGECRSVGRSTGADSASKVARGAAIGALVDGSDGARGGAKWGAGAALVTRGQNIYVPSGSLLEFTTVQSTSR